MSSKSVADCSLPKKVEFNSSTFFFSKNLTYNNMEILVDRDGRLVKSGYFVDSPMYGKHIFFTLEAAKEFVKKDVLPRVWFMYYDFNDKKYYSFTIYSVIPEKFLPCYDINFIQK